MEALEHDTYLIVSSPAIALVVPPHAARVWRGASGLAYIALCQPSSSSLRTFYDAMAAIINAAAAPPKTRVDFVRENQLGFLK
jgi:hypothetical protein